MTQTSLLPKRNFGVIIFGPRSITRLQAGNYIKLPTAALDRNQFEVNTHHSLGSGIDVGFVSVGATCDSQVTMLGSAPTPPM